MQNSTKAEKTPAPTPTAEQLHASEIEHLKNRMLEAAAAIRADQPDLALSILA